VGSRRNVILIIAVVVAAVAGVVTVGYLNGADSRAAKGQELVQVYKVEKDVPKALPAEKAVSDGYIKKDTVPAKLRPTTSVTDLSTVRGKVALYALAKNQVLVEGQFVDPKVEQITNAQRLAPGRVAVTVNVDAVHGVAGLLVPGDKVNIAVRQPDAVRYLYQNVEVLFIGGQAAPQPGDRAAPVNPGSGLITFSVPPAAAARIAYAAGKGDGSLYLFLVPPDNQPQQVPPVNDGNLFDGLTPYPA
jgi:Flp pilus assembly protein CpaB